MEHVRRDNRSSEISDQLDPELADLSGYRVRQRDLGFLGLTLPDIRDWRARNRSLGLSAIQYDALVRELGAALGRDGVGADECDVRLKGSSANFFSGVHKPMPLTDDDMKDLFRTLRGRYPSAWEVEEIGRRFREVWITDGELPSQRPFDSMYRLGIDREPSDIDLQISSDALTKRCEALLAANGQAATDVRFKHPVYNFVRKDLVEAEFPHLFLYTLRMADALGRHVSIAVFPRSGPPNVSDTHPDLSSHLVDDDWMIQLPRTRVRQSVA